MFISALFGDLEVSFAPDRSLFFHAGRNGRLHVTEPDGSVRGNHPYLSAVAVLRLPYPADVWAAALSQNQVAGNTDPVAIFREAQQLVAQQQEEVAEAICLDLFETVSESAVPLPREVFTGPGDTRWGVINLSHYGQIGGPRA